MIIFGVISMSEPIQQPGIVAVETPISAVDFPGERMRWSDLFLALVAVIPIFVNLGLVQSWGSEHRWLDISAGILATGNWFEPRLEGQFYGDKPLLSYWAVVLASWAAGHLDEGIARLPSAIAGAITVLITAWLAARLLGRRTAVLAAWILATAFSFFLWSRTASADLLSMCFLTAAVAVYVEGVLRFRPWKTILFFLLLALGGQAKGMPAVLLPLGIAGLDMIFFRRVLLLRQAGWIAMGFTLGAGFYLLPFLLSYLEGGDWQLLQLMWKENFIRGFNAFDHKDKVYYYVYILPAMFIPWSLWLPGALGWAGTRFRSHPGWRFCLLAFVVIFLFFTVSESRRSYYILPVFPFCALLVAGFLSDLALFEKAGNRAGRTWRFLARFPIYIFGSVLVLGMIFLLAGPFLSGQHWIGMVGEIARDIPYSRLLALALAGCLALLVAGCRRHRLDWQFRAVALLALVAVGYFSTGIEPLRADRLIERAFASQVAIKYPGVELVYYLDGNATSRYYLGPGIRVKSNAEVLELLQGGRDPLFLVCEGDDIGTLEQFQPVIFSELLKGVVPGLGTVVKPETRYLLLKCTRR